MKNCILYIIMLCCASYAAGQNVIAQIEQIDVELVSEQGILLVHTIGEPIAGVDFQSQLSVISGYYPLVLLDTTGTSVVRDLNPIEGLIAYPNPTQTTIMLSGVGAHHREFRIEMFDVHGQFIDGKIWYPGEDQYELSFAARGSGSYLLRVIEPESGRTSHLRIVKH